MAWPEYHSNEKRVKKCSERVGKDDKALAAASDISPGQRKGYDFSISSLCDNHSSARSPKVFSVG